jgi:hypothetical protein
LGSDLGRLGVWWAVIISHSLVGVGRDVVMEVLNFYRMEVRFDALWEKGDCLFPNNKSENHLAGVPTSWRCRSKASINTNV